MPADPIQTPRSDERTDFLVVHGGPMRRLVPFLPLVLTKVPLQTILKTLFKVAA